MRERYIAREVGPRQAGELQRSMYALRRDGIPALVTWPPVSGWYEKPWMIPGSNGPQAKRWLPIRIWLSPAHDPETGELLDRSPTWLCEVDGHPALIEDAWPECSGRPITEEAYIELLEQRDREAP